MSDIPITERFAAANTALPLVAILRGIRPEEAEAAAHCLFDAGFRLIEVPLNSPDPFTSIATMRRVLPMDALVGAGTVLNATQMQQLKDCGGELAVMPHADTALIRQETGWQPQVDWAAGLAGTAAWLQATCGVPLPSLELA